MLSRSVTRGFIRFVHFLSKHSQDFIFEGLHFTNRTSNCFDGRSMILNGSSSCCGASAASYFQAPIENYQHTPKDGEPYSFKFTPSSMDDLTYLLEGAEDLPDFDSMGEGEAGSYLEGMSSLEAMCRAVVASQSSLFGYPTNPVLYGINAKFGKSYRNSETGRMMWPEADPDLVYFDLPGHGTLGRCGIVTDDENRPELVGCVAENCCHYAHFKRWYCGRPQCSDWHCLMHYCQDKAEEGLDRLRAADMLYNDTRERIQHVVLSWDPKGDFSWMTSRKSFNAHMVKAYKLLQEVGLLGGLAVVHAERWKGEDVADSSGDPVKLFPKDALKNGLRWRFGLHIHAVAFGWIDPDKVAEVYARTGIVIKSIASENREGKRLDDDDVRNILAYCLSHAGLGVPLCGEGKTLRVLRPFGICASGSKRGLVKVARVTSSEPVECPVCKVVSPSFPEHLYPLREFMYSRFTNGPPLEPVKKTTPFGIYCTRGSVDWVRQSLKGRSPPEAVEFARSNPDFVFTRCLVADMPRPRSVPVQKSSRVLDEEFAAAAEAILRKLGLGGGP